MDDLKRARKNAQARRKDVLTGIAAVRGRLTLPKLADDALSILDPRLLLPRRIKMAVSSQPLAAALVLGAAAWLLATGDGKPPGRSGRTRAEIDRSTKGDEA